MLQGSTEEVKKQAEQRNNCRIITYVPGILNLALKNTRRGRRHGNSAAWQKLKRARDYLNSAEKQSCGTILERYLEDEQYQMRMEEQGCTQSDMEEFGRIADAKRNYVGSSAERVYCRDQYKVVPLYQGGGSDTVKTDEDPDYRHTVQWKRVGGNTKTRQRHDVCNTTTTTRRREHHRRTESALCHDVTLDTTGRTPTVPCTVRWEDRGWLDFDGTHRSTPQSQQKRKTWPNNPQNPTLNSGHRTWKLSSRPSWWDSSSSQTWWQSPQPTSSDVPALVLDTRKNTSSERPVVATQVRQRWHLFWSSSNRQSECDKPQFSALRPSDARTFDAPRTLQHFYGSRSDWNVTPSSYQTMTCFAWVRRVPLPWTGTSATCLSHFHICAITHVLVWQYDVTPNKLQVISPTPTSQSTLRTVRWIRAEQGLVQQWTWRVTMTTQFLTCPTFRCSDCKYSVAQFCMGDVLTRWRRPHAKCSQSPTDTKSDRSESLVITVSRYIPSECTCSSWTSRSVSIGYNEHEKLFTTSAKRLDVLYSNNNEKFLAATDQYEASARQNFVNTFGKKYNEALNSNVQMQVRQLEHEEDARCSLRQKGTIIAMFSGNKSSSWISARNFGNGSNIRSMETRRTSTCFTYRTESSCTTLGRRFASKSRIRWTT